MRYLIVNVPSNLLLQGLSDLSRSIFSRKLVEAGDRVQEIFYSRFFLKLIPMIYRLEENTWPWRLPDLTIPRKIVKIHHNHGVKSLFRSKEVAADVKRALGVKRQLQNWEKKFCGSKNLGHGNFFPYSHLVVNFRTGT